ncbi:hypothetical protein IAT38_005741 [Cryptococcus sp. DSM 104549]
MSAQDFEVSPGEIPAAAIKELEIAEGDKNVRYQRFQVTQVQEYLAHLRLRVKGVKQFWLAALLDSQNLAPHITSKLDRHALSFLEDIELVQEVNDFRPYELIFHFAENPYFSNKTLSKKYTLSSGTAPAPADGFITDELRKFTEDDLEASATKIDWKSDAVNLTAKMPRISQTQGGDADDLEDGFEGDAGSFFHYFEEEADLFQIGGDIKDELLPEAFAHFEGRSNSELEDVDSEEEELDEEDDDDEDEIDLEEEKHKQKKRKVGGK